MPNTAFPWVAALSKLEPNPLCQEQIDLYREALCRCISTVAAGGRVSNEELETALTHALCISRHRVESPKGVFLTEEPPAPKLPTGVNPSAKDAAPVQGSSSYNTDTKALLGSSESIVNSVIVSNELDEASVSVGVGGCSAGGGGESAIVSSGSLIRRADAEEDKDEGYSAPEVAGPIHGTHSGEESAITSLSAPPFDISNVTAAPAQIDGEEALVKDGDKSCASPPTSPSVLLGRSIRAAYGTVPNVAIVGDGTTSHGVIIVGPVRGHACDFANLLLDEVFTAKKEEDYSYEDEVAKTGRRKREGKRMTQPDEDLDRRPAAGNDDQKNRPRQFQWPKSSIIILGNLIDGGQQSVEVVALCCWLLLALPTQLVILKGAHELLFPISNECTSQLVGRLDKELRMRFTKLSPQFSGVLPTQSAWDRKCEEERKAYAEKESALLPSVKASSPLGNDNDSSSPIAEGVEGSPPTDVQTASLQSTLSALGNPNTLINMVGEESSPTSSTLLLNGGLLSSNTLQQSTSLPSWKQLMLNTGIPRTLGPSPFINLPRPSTDDDSNVRNEQYYQLEREIYDLFDTFPLACVVDGRYFCTTGGIPATVTKIKDINSGINRMIEGREDGVDFEKCCELVFSDPMDEDDESRLGPMALFAPNLERGLSHVFSYNAACRFLATNELTSIIRASSYTSHRFSRATNLSGRMWHYQYSPRDVGFRLYKAGPTSGVPTVISIFSAPEFESVNQNIGAFIELPPMGKQRRKKNKKTSQGKGRRLDEERLNNMAIRQFNAAPNRPLQLPGTTANAFSWSLDLMSYYSTSAVAAMLSDTSFAPESMVISGKEAQFYSIAKARKKKPLATVGGISSNLPKSLLGTIIGAAKEVSDDEDDDLLATSEVAKARRGGRMARRMQRMVEQKWPPFGSSFNNNVASLLPSQTPNASPNVAKNDVPTHTVVPPVELTTAEKADRLVPNLHSQYLAPHANKVPIGHEAQLHLATEALLEQYKRKLVRLCVLVAEEGIPVEQVRSAVLPSGSRATSAATSPQNVSLSVGLGSSLMN